jgi:hypothetical protein
MSEYRTFSTLYELQTWPRSVSDVASVPVRTDLAGLGEHAELLLRLRLDLGAPDAEGLELVDELVDDVPEPLLRELELHGAFRVWMPDEHAHTEK